MVLHLWRLLPNHFSVWLRQLLYIKWYNIVVADFPGMMQDIQNLTLDCFFFINLPKYMNSETSHFQKLWEKKKSKDIHKFALLNDKSSTGL